ncbi:hypothetical protein BSZ28_04395 [Pseudomonas moraviensis]|nr:hypothetical protein BSZ28_04395 [Pseudomonas moraviensis]
MRIFPRFTGIVNWKLYDDLPFDAEPLWERACSRMRTFLQWSCRLTQRFREQARSHRVPWCPSSRVLPVKLRQTSSTPSTRPIHG